LQNNNSNDDIKNILDSLSGGGIEHSSPYEAEFVFGEKNAPKGLVFDDSAVAEAPESEKQNLSFELAKEERAAELSVPDKFVADEKYSSEIQDEAKPRIIATYVPRFTEASLNYRMAGEKRQDFVKVKTVDATAEFPEEKMDPTAEIYSETEATGAVKVSTAKSEDESLESASKVFKFLENEIPDEPAAQAPEISVPVDDADEVSAEESFAEETENADDAPKEYSIPDPSRALDTLKPGVISADSVRVGTLEDAPEDVGEKIQEKSSVTEYTSYAQRDSIKDKFLDVIMSVRVRFFAAAAITLLLAVLEIAVAFSVNVVGLFKLETVPGALALLDGQFVLCLFLLSLPETAAAFKRLSQGRLVSALYLPMAFAVLAVYTVVIVIKSPEECSVFGLLFAVPTLAAIGADYFKSSTEFAAFKKISQNEEKRVIDNHLTRTLEHENAALDGAIEEHKSRIMRIFRTVFVSDFFKRLERCTEKTSNVALLLFAPLGAALVTGTVVFFVPGGIEKAAAALALVFLLAVPSMALLIHRLPCFCAQVEAGEEDSAFVGESSLIEYSAIDVITFDDTEVFGPDDVTLQRIMLYGRSDNLTKALRQMSSLFMNVGGPLDRLFSDALDRKASAAVNTYIENGGIYGEIDSHPAFAGTLDYMIEKGVRIPDDEAESQEKLSDSIKVMYAALDGEVYAKFYIRYSFSEEFSMLLPTLEDEGIKVLVYTSDPNITSDLIKSLTAGTDNIRVMRRFLPTTHDSVIYREVSAGMVTFGEKSNAINMIILAKRYSKLTSRLAITELIAMAVGGVLGILLSLGGMLLVPSAALAVWQAAWCGVLHIVSRREFRCAKKKKGN